jgi:hypothetical protein
MSELMTSAAIPADPDVEIAAIRTKLIGKRVTYQQLAAALRCSERSIYNVVEKLKVPYVSVLGRRHVDPDDFRAALEKRQANTTPRTRGRPRKNAA